MMLDCDLVAVIPSSIHRVLKADRKNKRLKKAV